MFAFKGHQLRGVKIDGEPWFVAADACRCLGLEARSTVHRAIDKLDADEKRLVKRGELPSFFDGSQAPSAYFITRPDLFKLIQRSNKPEAKEFDRWVRHEVLPTFPTKLSKSFVLLRETS